MTSWNRGRENEQEGDEKMSGDSLGDKIGGAAQKGMGAAEQGADNLGDTISGKQGKLEGDNAGNAAERAGDWAQNRGDDLKQKMD